MAKQNAVEMTAQEKLKAFAAKNDSELNEGTASYFKFEKPEQALNGIFVGIERRNLDSTQPDREVECAILLNEQGERLILAQTVVVKELKKKWDELKEVGFPVRIIFKGNVGSGADQYQSFRLLF